MNDNIRNLKEQIANEERRINSCSHTFGKPYYNAETVREGYGSRMNAQGSDVWFDYEGYRDVKKDRWTRKCTKCGYEQHTNTQEPVIKEYIPKFN